MLPSRRPPHGALRTAWSAALRTVSRAVLPLVAATALGAQVRLTLPATPPDVDALHAPGQNVTISLLTMGPSADQIWEMFGHAAIWIHDNTTQRDTVFNWGEFDSSQPFFIWHFIQDRNQYRMGGGSLDETVAYYKYFRRTLVSQRLNLTNAQKDSLLHLMQINAEPENVQYRYDYFRDNCATRPRDLLDQVTGGALRASSQQVTDHSYRWHTLRLMQDNTLITLGVDVGLGEPSDKPIARWDEMFLPQQLHDVVAAAQVRDSQGALRPLVARESVLLQSDRPPEPAAPPKLGVWLLALGVVIAALIAWLGLGVEPESRGRRIVTGLVIGLWSLVAGLLGCALTFLWLFTDHVFARSNENLLLFNPLWLILAVMALVYYVSGRAERATRSLAALLALFSAIALLAHPVGLSRQSNLPLIGLALPAALVIAWLTTRADLARARPATDNP
ncbi:MAG TPA: DUF4105 domain-containing protein [Gemmatimonadaceae bacterium]|jgi:hypothetical protein